MAIILYAITRDGYFCKKETPENKIDDLAWMRVSTDRHLFRELTTLFPNQPILVGCKTASVLPKLKNRQIIPISHNPSVGPGLTPALIKYPNSILIGGANVIKNAMSSDNMQYINSIITISLPIDVPESNIYEYEPDPLAKLKQHGKLNQSAEFLIHTANNLKDEIIMQIWRKTQAKNI